MWRQPAAVVEEVKFWQKAHGVIDFALYDDAFLINAQQHAIPLLKGLVRPG